MPPLLSSLAPSADIQQAVPCHGYDNDGENRDRVDAEKRQADHVATHGHQAGEHWKVQQAGRDEQESSEPLTDSRGGLRPTGEPEQSGEQVRGSCPAKITG